jgi:hypothetical protein
MAKELSGLVDPNGSKGRLPRQSSFVFPCLALLVLSPLALVAGFLLNGWFLMAAAAPSVVAGLLVAMALRHGGAYRVTGVLLIVLAFSEVELAWLKSVMKLREVVERVRETERQRAE